MKGLLLALALLRAAPGGVVASVEGEPITLREVQDRARAGGLPPVAALEAAIVEAVLAHAARVEGLARHPGLRAELAAERERLVAQRLLEQHVFPRVRVGAPDVRRLFHARTDRVNLGLVVRPSEAEAAEVLARLRAGGSLVEEGRLARPAPAGRALFAWVCRGELPAALARVAFDAPPRVPVGPVPVPGGFAVAVVHDRVVGDERELARLEPALRGELELERRAEARAAFLGALRRRWHDPDAGTGDHLLALEAARRGVDRDPALRARLRGAERRALAAAYQAEHQPSQEQLAALRRSARVRLDERALAAAAVRPPGP